MKDPYSDVVDDVSESEIVVATVVIPEEDSSTLYTHNIGQKAIIPIGTPVKVTNKTSLIIAKGAHIWGHVSAGQTLENPNDCLMELKFNDEANAFELKPVGAIEEPN